MKKLLIPLLALASLSACEIYFGPQGTPDRDPNRYLFNEYVVIGNPAENYGDTILVYPDFDLEFTYARFPKDSLYDIFVISSSNIEIHNIDTTREASFSKNSFFLQGDTLKCSIIHSDSGWIRFVIHDPDDNVINQEFPSLTLNLEN